MIRAVFLTQFFLLDIIWWSCSGEWTETAMTFDDTSSCGEAEESESESDSDTSDHEIEIAPPSIDEPPPEPVDPPSDEPIIDLGDDDDPCSIINRKTLDVFAKWWDVQLYFSDTADVAFLS